MTHNQNKNWKSYCSEPLELVENYMAAKADDFEGWCMHHRREIKLDGTRVSIQELKDQGLYFHRPASELVFMKVCEHSTLHHKDKVISEETRKKLSEALKGKRHSADTLRKMSMSLKGFYKGTRWWNDGVSCKRAKECPGPEWKPGRILKP